MSGHSKWSTIKRQKGKSDAARAKVFTKIGRELAVAVKSGGADPSHNPKLRDCIAKARAANMPNDIVSRNIKKYSGELDNINFESIVYEGYGIEGSAVIVECLTDNKNRTAGDIRHTFDKYGGSLGSNGCVAYGFETKGVLVVDSSTVAMSQDEFVLFCLEYDIEDVLAEDSEFVIYTTTQQFANIREAMQGKGINFINAQIDRIPSNTVELGGDSLSKFETMIDKFEDNDDVQAVYHNVNLQFNDK